MEPTLPPEIRRAVASAKVVTMHQFAQLFRFSYFPQSVFVIRASVTGMLFRLAKIERILSSL